MLAPALPHDHGAPPAPSTIMYWSPMAVHGLLPNRGLRAHSVNLVDQLAWVYGGTDEKGCWSDVWCFDTGASSSLLSLRLGKGWSDNVRRDVPVVPPRDDRRAPTPDARTHRHAARP